MTKPIQSLSNTFLGMTGAAVGSGPSIRYITKDHFKDVDVVITLDFAELKVSSLKLDIPHFAQWKDAGHKDGRCLPTCKVCKGDCYKVRPTPPAMLLVHTLESALCWNDYEPRYSWNNEEWGYTFGGLPGATCALWNLKILGIKHLKLFCFDGITVGDTRNCCSDGSILQSVGTYGNFFTEGDEAYRVQPHLREKVKDPQFETVEWITPGDHIPHLIENKGI